MVLVVRKAFSFKHLPTKSLNLGKHQEKGFGFVSKEPPRVYILACPSIINRRIKVTVRLLDPVQEEVCYIDCKSDISEAGEELRSMVLGFLAEVVLYERGEGIRW